MNIQLPHEVKSILKTLRDGGCEAYIVGGCVRDAILNRTPKDWDITTNALPEQVRKLFPHTIPTGIQHGTVTVMIGKTGYEVTTYRVDGVYEDARHPKEVTFTASLAEDLKRRDFTINAMAWNAEDGLVDLYHGMDDMEAHVIRCVGDAKERFSEDALRMMRAFRFAAQLDFRVEEKTRAAAEALAQTLPKVSAERIRDELLKLICAPHPARIRDLYQAGLTAQFLPEFDRCMETQQVNPHHRYDVGEHIIAAVEQIRPEPVLRLTMLLHDIAKPETRTTDDRGIDHFYGHAGKSAEAAGRILRRLRCDNVTIRRTKNLIRYHDAGVGMSIRKESVRRMIHKVGKDDFPLLLEVIAADNAAKASEISSARKADIAQVRQLYEEILRDGDPLDIADLAVNGSDLMENGIGAGPEIGDVLERMLTHVLKYPANNTRDYLLDGVRHGQFRRTEQAEQ